MGLFRRRRADVVDVAVGLPQDLRDLARLGALAAAAEFPAWVLLHEVVVDDERGGAVYVLDGRAEPLRLALSRPQVQSAEQLSAALRLAGRSLPARVIAQDDLVAVVASSDEFGMIASRGLTLTG